MWKKVIEKAVNIKAKANLQLLSEIKEIDSRCLKSYKPLDKKEKNKACQKHYDRNKDKIKAKSHNALFTYPSQPQTQAFKKNKCHRSYERDFSSTGVNATNIPKKDKDKAKDLSHIKYYTTK